MKKQKYRELIDKYLVTQSENSDYDPPSYRWVDNTGEIVRCKDCMHHEYSEEYGVLLCTGAMAEAATPDDWYCAGAIRRDSETPQLVGTMKQAYHGNRDKIPDSLMEAAKKSFGTA